MLRQHTERALATLAALLLGGAGLIFWVAANWQDQTLQFKFLLIQAVLLASVAVALLVRLADAQLVGLADAQLQPLQAQAAPR